MFLHTYPHHVQGYNYLKTRIGTEKYRTESLHGLI